jgi:PAS domain S-box-containing protein
MEVTVATDAERVLACLDEGIALCDASGQVVLTNPAFGDLLGVAVRQGQPVLVALEADTDAKRAVTEALEGTMVTGKDLHRRGQRGESRWVRLSARRLPTSESDSTPIVLLVLREVSELRRVEQDIGQVEKMAALGRLASSLAHEVGNPLGAIDIQLQLLQEDLNRTGGDAAARSGRRVVVARTEMRRLEGIVRNFLRFSRPPALHLRTMSPNDLLSHIHALVEPEARERGLRLELTLDSELPSVEVDENQLSQALLNVLINSFQAVSPGGNIGLRSSLDQTCVLLEISDDGPGIPADDLERVFEFYYTTKEEGTGLGLSIAQRIVHQHGGAIEVISQEGRGTKVGVRLPVPRGIAPS